MKFISIQILIFFSYIFTLHCQENKINEYKMILKNLYSNEAFILEESRIEAKYYYEIYKISPEEHNQKIEKYWATIPKLLSLDKNILYYLISFEKEHKKVRDSWVKKINPLRSDTYGFYSRSEEARILIDFYLKGESKKIEAPIYFKNITFRKLKRFLRKHKQFDKDQIRISYKNWIKSF